MVGIPTDLDQSYSNNALHGGGLEFRAHSDSECKILRDYFLFNKPAKAELKAFFIIQNLKRVQKTSPPF